jgi:hypothetical protein
MEPTSRVGEVLAALSEAARIEAERDVRVVFACESGSRAWGFASRDAGLYFAVPAGPIL